jgi:2-amino-4-hydroxy-6-hydroxymethyldihydropteridine diphosphokinase
MQYYYLGLGSNIDPFNNVPRMLEALQGLSPQLAISTIIGSRPKGMISNNPFLNLAVRIQSDLSPEALKAQFNAIETALGRDRTDPNRSYKDRTADIDILFHTPLTQSHIPLQEFPPEPYLNRPLADLLYFLGIRCDAPKPQFDKVENVLFRDVKIGNHPIWLNLVEA